VSQRKAPRLRFAYWGLLTLAAFLLAACAPQVQQYRFLAFGSNAQLSLVSDDPQLAERAARQVGTRLAQWQREWHAWQPSSLTALNRDLAAGRPHRASAELVAMLREAQSLSARSGGLLDPGAGRLIAAWGFHQGRWPADDTNPAADFLAQWQADPTGIAALRFAAGGISASDRRVSIDLNAIAEGFAARQLRAELRALGVRNALLGIGGDVVALGQRGPRPWRAQLLVDGRALARVDVADGLALFSAGSGERQRRDGRSHLLNPATALPVSGARLVAVLHADPVLADAAATALAIADADARPALAARLGVGCVLWVDADAQPWISAAMADKVRWRGGAEARVLDLNSRTCAPPVAAKAADATAR